MSFLIELINSENDENLREELIERVDIVLHKIKFMEKVPVICFTGNNDLQTALDHLITLAGGKIVSMALEAKAVLYFEHQQGIGNLIANVATSISSQWPAVTYNRVYIIDDSKVLAKTPSDLVGSLEDIAEILHPGFFVFGNEGENWINFQA